MNSLTNRKFIVGMIFIVIAFIFTIRLFYVQVVNDKYKLNSDNNVLREIVQYPARGLVYDRNGELLVYNEAAYDLMFVPKQLKEIDTVAFCSLLDIDKTTFIEKVNKAKAYSRYKPSIFIKEISSFSYASIQEQLFKYSAFFVQTRTLRKYPTIMQPMF